MRSLPIYRLTRRGEYYFTSTHSTESTGIVRVHRVVNGTIARTLTTTPSSMDAEHVRRMVERAGYRVIWTYDEGDN